MKVDQFLVRVRHDRPFAWLRLHDRRRRRMAVAGLWAAFAAHVAVSGFDGELAGFGGAVTLIAGLVCLFSLGQRRERPRGHPRRSTVDQGRTRIRKRTPAGFRRVRSSPRAEGPGWPAEAGKKDQDAAS